MGTESNPDEPDRAAEAIREEYAEAIEHLAGIFDKPPEAVVVDDGTVGYTVIAGGPVDVAAASDGPRPDADDFYFAYKDEVEGVPEAFGVLPKDVKLTMKSPDEGAIEVRKVRP